MYDTRTRSEPDDLSETEKVYLCAVAVAADSVAVLRSCDVERVVGLVPPEDRVGLTGWLIGHRPDLKGAVATALSDIAQDELV